jgi:DnaJ-class molecular chaperone
VLFDDYYAWLSVEPQATAAELRRAWRRLALRWHPDRAGPGAKSTFQMILGAYQVLADPVARAAYDRRRSATTSGPASMAATRPDAPAVLLRRLSGPLNALLACGVARRAEQGVFELFLTAREAADGGMVEISMRVPVHCPACPRDPERCTRCGTRRVVEELFSAWLAVPPGVAEGVHLVPSAVLDGMVHPVEFRVRLPRAT